MRIAHLLMIVMAAAAAALLAGCERESGDRGAPAAPTTGPATRAALPTLTAAERLRAVTQPAATQAATGPATTRASAPDPLATPNEAVTHLFELMKKEDVLGVRAMMADPLPVEKLRGEVSGVAKRLNSGAKWEIVNSRDDGVIGMVIFRTTFPDGRADIESLVCVNRYGRWKVLLGALNLKKFTAGEKESMNRIVGWGADRLDELRGISTSKPATQAATKATAPTPTP